MHPLFREIVSVRVEASAVKKKKEPPNIVALIK